MVIKLFGKMYLKILRTLLLPFGFLKGMFEMAKDGSRDIYNWSRFRNSIIDKGCCINEASTISPNCHILELTTLNNVSVGSYTYVGRRSLIQNATIGRFCSIANEVMIGLGTHPTNLFSTSPLFYRRNNTFRIPLIEEDLQFQEYETVNIGHDVWIGARAVIMDGVSVGHGAIIATCSVVTKDVPPYAIVAGIPATIIRFRVDEEQKDNLLAMNWWDLDIEQIKPLATKTT